MANKSIINIIEKGDIANELKVAYKYMLLSRGYSEEEIKILDDYIFSVRKKGDVEIKDDNKDPRRLRRENTAND